MTQADVDRMHVRWRGPGPERRAALTEALLDWALPEAVAIAVPACGAHGEVCVRRIDVPTIVVGPDEPDDEVAGRWAAHVAGAIAHAVATGEAVVFRSPHHALADMAVGVARGQLRRAWAWRAAGVWPAGTLCPEDAGGPAPEPVPPPDGCGPTSVSGGGVPTPGAVGPRRPVPPGGGARRARAGHASPYDDGPDDRRPPAERADGRAVADPSSEVATDARPGQQRQPVALQPPTFPLPRPGVGPGPGPAGEDETPAPRQASVTPRPAAWPAADLDAGADALTAALLTRREAAPAVLDHVARLGLLPALEARLGPARMATLPVAASLRLDRPARRDDVVAEAVTCWGGLLFLIHLVEPPVDLYALGTAVLTGLLTEDERLDRRDPALLAFAGLAPDDDPPRPPEGHPPSSLPLLERLGAAGVDAASACRRRAVVVADPGWIEVRYSLDDVDVDIRRAGLDLDPGWLPWLSVVMRFTYA